MTISQSSATSRLIWRVFTRDHGLACNAEAVQVLSAYLGHCFGAADTQGHQQALQTLAKAIRKAGDSIVDATVLQKAMEALVEKESTELSQFNPDDHIRLVDAFDSDEAWTYDAVQRSFGRRGAPVTLFGTAEDKMRMWGTRFELARIRALLLPQFVSQGFSQSSQSSRKVLRRI